MRKKFDHIKSNLMQLIEVLLLAFVIILPFFLDLKDLFQDYLANNPLSPDNLIWYLAITKGKYLASGVLLVFFLILIRKFNREYVMNNHYNITHDYCYVWYWICAKVLGIKKCSLVHVPIHMQFKLVIRCTFNEYPLNDGEYPVVIDEPDPKVSKTNFDAGYSEINIILEDTYIIEDSQIPISKRDLLTIRISRNDGKDRVRHFSPKFIETTMNTVRECKYLPIVNVFATTNPKNTMHIAKRAFALSDRGNIEHLFVFQQKKEKPKNVELRNFEEKKYRIY